MQIPNVDFSPYDESQPNSLQELGEQIYTALSGGGFMTVSNLGIDPALRDKMFTEAKRFFHGPTTAKLKCAYRDAEENFGYQGVGEEHLHPGTAADLKQTFTMRNLLEKLDQDDRWPSSEFKNTSELFYRACLEGALKVQRVFSYILKKEPNFFVDVHGGENITMRVLNYPALNQHSIDPKQLGAGAHTDYGMITLLFQDDIAGLEVQDKLGQWIPVSPDKDKIVINTGDLMERWTNGIFRSTTHRVQPQMGSDERFSIAVFFDPDDDTLIETLPSCVNKDKPNQYSPITAGEHILQKIRATHGHY